MFTGVIATELTRHLNAWYHAGIVRLFQIIAKTPFYGAQTSIYCALDDAIECETGMYYSDCAKKNPASQALNKEDQKKLWEISESMVGLKSEPWIRHPNWDYWIAVDNAKLVLMVIVHLALVNTNKISGQIR